MLKRGFRKSVVAALACVVFSQGYLAGVWAQESAEKLEELAAIQRELASGYESLAEKRIKDAFKQQSLNDYVAVGDLLNRAGDEKFVAFESYQRAKTHWENAAKTHAMAGDDLRAREARGNADKSGETSKRILREGAEIYQSTVNMYEYTGNLEKKWEVMGKLARNLERLAGMK